MTQFLDTPIDKSLSTTDVWTDIDLSSDIPSYATGAVFQIINIDAGGDHTFGLRKNGSSDDRCKSIDPDAQVFMIVGVDGNQICEGRQNSNYVDFYLVGYTESDATLFTNGYDKSQTTLATWTDLDLNSELPVGSVAAIFEVYNNGLLPKSWGLRKKGSTDNRYDDLRGLCHVYFITGIDANRKCQFKIESTDIDFFLLGYLKSGTSEINGVDRSLGSTGSYIDITESDAPTGATGAFVEFDTSTISSAFGARKNGISWDKYYLPPANKSMILVGLDESKKWESKIATTNHDFYTLGYFASTVEWLSGYTYRKKGAVNATTAGAQTNYQLKLVVGESSGASGEDVDCENHCEDFPNDIRFTKEDGVTKHDYWIDTSSLSGTTPNRKVDAFIEVAAIPASGSVDFYIYYGKSGDGGESEGDDTFEFFDDFECPETLQLIKTTKENVHLSTDYCMDPNMCMLHDGTWFVVFREGSVHTYSSSGKARFVTSSNKGESWSSASTIYDTANKDDRQPNVLEFQEGSVWTILVAWTITIANPIDDNCEAVKIIKSTNGGTSWGTPITVTTGDDMRVTGNPIQMANGNILLPLTAYVTGKKRNKVAISDDDGVNWTIYNASDHYTDGRCNELAVVEYEAGKLLGIARNQAGSYFNKITSANYGVTWTAPVLTNVPSPKDRPHLILLQSGDIALTYAHTDDDYRIVISSDNGVTWGVDDYCSVYYESGIAAFSGYPASIEYEENKVFSIFEIQASSSDEDIYGNKINIVNVKWDIEGAVSVSNGVVHIDNDDWITGKTAFGNGYCYETRAKANEQDTCFVVACQTHNVWNDDIIIIGNSDLYPDDFDRFFLDFWKAASQNTVSLDNWNDFRDVYYHYCIKKISNSKVIMEQELNSSTYTNSTYITTENLKLACRVWDSSQESQLDVDFALVRKYADPEPTWGSWSGESTEFKTKTSSAGLSISEENIKTSSAGIRVIDRKTKTSSAGLVVIQRPYEDFTTFTEVDVGADRIQKTAYHIDHLSYRNEATYLYKDYGTSHFGDFTHKIKVKQDGTPEDYAYGVVWMLSNDLGATQDLRDANKSYIEIFFYRDGSNLHTYLREVYNGTCYDDSNIVALHTDWRYIKIVKSGTSLTAYMYSSSDYSTLVDTLTLTMHVDGSYKYLFGCNSLNDGDTQSMATDVENFDIGRRTKESSAGLRIVERHTKESSAGLSIQETNTKASSAGLRIVERHTKESSAGLSIQETNTKASSAGLRIVERHTKASSAGLRVIARQTKASSAGLSIQETNTKASSASLSISAEGKNISTLGLTIVNRIAKESSAGLTVIGANTKESSAGLSIQETNTKASSAGISIMNRIIKGNKERVQGLVFDVIVADGTSTKTEIKTNNNSINNIIATDFYFEVPQLSTPNKTARLELLTTRDNVIFSSGDLNASTAKKYGFFVLRGLMDVTKYRVTTDANVTGNKTFNVEMRGLNAPDVSTMGLTVIDRITKESSASLTVKASYTKESSAGISITLQQLKQSSAGLTISGANTLISSAGLTIFEPALKKGLFYGKLGDVILETVMPESFRISEEINRIPTFEFEVANSEANRTAIAANPTAIFKIYWQHHGVDTHIFTGIINADGVEYVSLSNIRITGFASYAKLGWPLYKHLNSEDAESVNTVFDFHGTYTDYTTQANNTTINDVIVGFGGSNHCLYVGEANPFWGLQIKYSTRGIPAGAVVVIEFSKGSGVWTTLDALDETNAFTEEPGTYDVIISHPPSDWARNTVDGISKFWIRWRVVSGAYSTPPKLDQIHTVNVDVYRVFYLATSAREILLDVLEDTEYSMDAIDACPEDEINLLAEYESPLRVIAAIPAALTWTDTDSSKKSYQWWIDEAKKVHMKKERGTTHSDDITGDLTIFNNLVDYFNISNRLFGFSKRDGLSQIRAIIENKASQTTHALREIAVPKNEIGKYLTLKASLEKDITYSKDPMQRIKGSVTTEFWGLRGYEVGDRVILHQGEWVVEEGAFQIVKADIGPILTQLNLGISREHLEGLKSNLKRTFDIQNVQMHGSTSLLTAGPETSNYERKSDGSVFSAKLKIEIPSEVVKTHKVLLSWTIGPYRASVNEQTSEGVGHDHGGFGGAGGAIAGGLAGAGGAFIPDVLDGGDFIPEMLSEAHKHLLETDVTLNVVTTGFYAPISTAISGLNHRHSGGGTGVSNDNAYAVTSLTWGEWCTACNYWLISTYDDSNSFATASHYHQNSDTGYTDPNAYIAATYKQLIQSIDANAISKMSDDEDPAHLHDGVYEPVHGHDGITEPAHSDHTIPAEPSHSDHLIITEPGGTLDIDYGIFEKAAETTLELLVNGEKVGEYIGNQEIRIDGYLSGSASNTVEIQPVPAELGKKGGATISASGVLFLEPRRF